MYCTLYRTLTACTMQSSSKDFQCGSTFEEWGRTKGKFCISQQCPTAGLLACLAQLSDSVHLLKLPTLGGQLVCCSKAGTRSANLFVAVHHLLKLPSSNRFKKNIEKYRLIICQHNMMSKAWDVQLTLWIAFIKSNSKIRSCGKQTFSIRLHGKDKSFLYSFVWSTHNYAANDSNHLCRCFAVSQWYAADIRSEEISLKNEKAIEDEEKTYNIKVITFI